MKNLTTLSLQLPLLCMAILCGPVQTLAEISAADIVHNEYHRDIGNDSVAKMTMTLKKSSGRTRVRTMTLSSILANDLRKQLIRFTTPKNISGTTFLSREINQEDDEQYLYLPAAGRPRRIVSGQKAKSFVNSNYTFEDMQRRHYTKDRIKKVGSDSLLGRSCIVIRREPVDPDSSQYGALEACVDPTIYVALRADYFDKSNKKIKTFTVKELKEINGIWTILHSELKDLDDNSSTELAVQSIEYNTGLNESEFSSSRLKSRD